MSSPRAAVPPRHLPSLTYSLPVRRLKDILLYIAPGVRLISVEEMRSTQLARLYALTMSDQSKLVLSLPPSLTVRLLRHETKTLHCEAALMPFVAASQRRQEGRSSSRIASSSSELAELIPTLLRHSQNSKELGYPYSIFEPQDGVPLSTVSLYLTTPERRQVDVKIGTIARSLASLTSPSGRFGMASRVLPDLDTSAASSASKSPGSKTWSEAFNILLESILRDGEDASVILPYDAIRAHFKRLAWRLDKVSVPRLVVLNLGDEDNVMVERTSLADDEEASVPPKKSTKVTGLRSWSQGVFGDPMIASCFDAPSKEFMAGWRAAGEEIIEDDEDTEGRKLLYQCYRGVVRIVTEYFRPQMDSSKRELEGRRKLTSAMTSLAKFDIPTSETPKRSRVHSYEVEDSKRQKKDMK